MVIVQLAGGLGNQMFQYALGRSLAINRSDSLALDVSRLSTLRPVRHYGLDIFELRAAIENGREILSRSSGVIWLISELSFGYCKEVLEDSGPLRDIGIVGWWQSEQYFRLHSATIRHDFMLKTRERCAAVCYLRAKICEMNSVCMHVRRTDYLYPGDDRGFVGIEYYKRALDVIKASVTNPTVFVFSDDIAWCRAKLNLDVPLIFVEHAEAPEQGAADDLYLMTLCKHFVIANSTFSWWAAWLGETPGKIIIAPRQWFRGERNATTDTASLRSDDLVPKRWTRV